MAKLTKKRAIAHVELPSAMKQGIHAIAKVTGLTRVGAIRLLIAEALKVRGL